MVIKNTLLAWSVIAKNNFQNQLLTPSSSIFFILGKLVTFLFALITIFAIFSTTDHLQGYNLQQAVIFVLVYNFTDSFIQFFFRSIYSFRPILIRGDYDLDLLKPLPSYFRPLIAGPDFLDLPSLLVQVSALIFFLHRYQLISQPSQVILFIVYFLLAFLVAFALHLLMAAFSILTTEVDNIAWIYRSFIRAATVPTDIYSGFFRLVLDYIVPVTLLVTIPAKALLGLLNPQSVIYAAIVSIVFVSLALWAWKSSLRHYASASS